MMNLSDIVLRDLAQSLMVNVYYPFSVCIWFDCAGNILKLWQFDTMYCIPEPDVPANARSCWLVSNHPDGDMRPCEKDIRNRDRIAARCSEMQLRMFIVSEDEGIRELYE